MSTISPLQQAVDITNEVISQCEDFDCINYYAELQKRSNDESTTQQVRELLIPIAAIASYHFKHENNITPYGPLFELSDGRSSVPDDLSDIQLHQLAELTQFIKPSALHARILDVLWLRLRNPKFAESAIRSFLNCSTLSFDLDHWTCCAEYAERALRLAAIFRRKTPELAQEVANQWLHWIEKYAETDKKFLTARALKLMTDFGYGDINSHLTYSKKIAASATTAGDFHRAEEYWKLAIATARIAKNNSEVISAQIALAETYASCAKTEHSSAMSAAHWMQQAVETYKSVPCSQKRREELYAELLEIQKASLSEMAIMSAPINLTGIIERTIKSIEGSDLRTAVFKFGFEIAKVPNYKEVETQAIELAQKYPLSHMFGVTHLDSEGKVVAKSPSSFLDTSESPPHHIYRNAAFEHQITVAGCIMPAVEVMLAEHSISLDDIESLATNNPFVVPGQERMWAQGLFSGFRQQFEMAIPILVPLLENSLRYVLKQSGVRVSTLNTHGVQEEMRIGAILDHELTQKIFGYDVVMDLKGLLIERTYANLRNVVSHGLGSTETYYNSPSIYLWWLMFRLFITTFAKKQIESKSSGN